MYPYYGGYVPLDRFDLDEDDILGIRSIYGKRKSPLEPPKTTQLVTAAKATTKATTKATVKASIVTTKTTKKATTALISTTKFSNKEIAPCNPEFHFIQAVFTSKFSPNTAKPKFNK